MFKLILKNIYRSFVELKVPFCNFFARIQVKYMGKKCKFHKLCKLTPNVYIGENCHFNGVEIQGKGSVKIGDNFHSGKGLLILTSDHNYDYGNKIPYDDTYITEDVIIENNVWVGARVIILRGVTLGEGCIIQAGSVVTKNIPPFSIAGGHPAIVFKHRNIDHYNKLKIKKYFY